MRLFRTAVALAVAAIACAVAGTASAATLTYSITGISSNIHAGMPNYFNGSAASATESGSWSSQIYAAFEQAPTPVLYGGYFNLTTGTKRTVTRSIRARFTSGTLTPSNPVCSGQKTYAIEAELEVLSGGAGVGHLSATITVSQSQLPYGCATALLSIKGNVTFVVD